MFTDAEKVAIRRHCGYPLAGPGPDALTGYRFFQSYGLLEFRLINMTSEEEAVVRTTYLENLATLETDIVGTRTNLDTESAAVWKHNANEQSDREALYDSWRKRLCHFLGVPCGPGLQRTGFRMVM